MWQRFVYELDEAGKKLLKQRKNIVIYTHNLGSFDGLFIFRGLLTFINKNAVNVLMDNEGKIITLKLNLSEEVEYKRKGETKTTVRERTYKFFDSLRVFPVSLQKLCDIFKSPVNKISSYDPEFNNLTLFNNPEKLFLKYSMSDSAALYHTMVNAQAWYYKEFSIDISEYVSTASLSLAIFRRKNITEDIDIIIPDKATDAYVRKAYYGGPVDYYYREAQNVKYVDVNSLFPAAMMHAMPHQVINVHSTMENIKLEKFWRFLSSRNRMP